MLNRWIEGDLLQVLGDEGIGCIVFSPLAQGVLTGKYLKGIPEESRAAKAHGFLRPSQITAGRLAKVEALQSVAKARGQSLAQLALSWVLRHPGVTSALIGANRVSHLEENVVALANLRFSEDELERIESILSQPEEGSA
jgi:L-glyceraldehyde 3-phosphate reductase